MRPPSTAYCEPPEVTSLTPSAGPWRSSACQGVWQAVIIFHSNVGCFFFPGMKGIHFLGTLFVQQTPHKRKMSLFRYIDGFVLAWRWSGPECEMGGVPLLFLAPVDGLLFTCPFIHPFTQQTFVEKVRLYRQNNLQFLNLGLCDTGQIAWLLACLELLSFLNCKMGTIPTSQSWSLWRLYIRQLLPNHSTLRSGLKIQQLKTIYSCPCGWGSVGCQLIDQKDDWAMKMMFFEPRLSTWKQRKRKGRKWSHFERAAESVCNHLGSKVAVIERQFAIRLRS